MRKLRFFAALCCAVAVLAACDKDNEPANNGQNDNPNNPPVENPDTVPAENPDTLVTAEYTLTVLSSDEMRGTVTGSGRYANGTKAAVAALPNDSCEFLSWSDCPSMELEREITLTSDSTITATFRSAYCTLTVLSNDEAMGTVTGSGKYAIGTRVQIEAMPKDGFMFSSWSNGQYDESIIIQLENDSTVTAEFYVARTGTENGHEWVDLGLPSGLKWATCNVGATAPEYEGDYYAWGKTETKENYSWDNYKYCDPTSTWTNGLGYKLPYVTKYCTYAWYGKDGFVDNKTTLEAEDDAAIQNWGGAWRMPTYDEWKELNDNCDWTWTTLNGVGGYEVKSKANGSTIYIPAAGYYDAYGLHDTGDFGYYWSSSLCEYNPDSALYAIHHWDFYGTERSYGLSVRPVVFK